MNFNTIDEMLIFTGLYYQIDVRELAQHKAKLIKENDFKTLADICFDAQTEILDERK